MTMHISFSMFSLKKVQNNVFQIFTIIITKRDEHISLNSEVNISRLSQKASAENSKIFVDSEGAYLPKWQIA